ncbi:polysaccharide deacetylase family protein [Kineosporia sp. A_224]|uniref:polysaccharide deacetylase family protein n=1 Tax=Kineosporia sp. A_224 TaxID=1962180 RepID=UPI000B4B97E9|nr:polysaccharide deacetylase family protein [Kineosporia sp. A_224]
MTGRWRAGLPGAIAIAAVVLAGCGAGTSAGTVTPSGTALPTTALSTAPSTSASTGTTARTTTRTAVRTTTPRTTSATRTTSGPPGTTTTAAPGVPAGMAGADLTVLPSSARVVALTFDAGANADGLASILGTLGATGAQATFFLTGDFVDTFPARARTIAAGGYTIGNHTQDHLDLTTLSDARVDAQIASAQARILAVTGQDPRPWFRFPFGARDSRTIADANDRGYACIRWTVDTLGWKGTSGGQSAATVETRVLDGLRPGAIVLMHIGSNPDDGTTLDADALPRVVAGLRSRGYTPVSLDSLLS